MLRFLIQWFIFLAINLVTVFIAGIWAFHSAKRDEKLSLIAHGLTIFTGVVLVALTALGALGILSLGNLFLLLSLVLIVSLLIAPNINGFFGYLTDLFSYYSLANVGISSYLFVLTAAGWGGIGFALTALLEPSTLVDTFVYHMPMVVKWAQTGTLMPLQIMGADIANSYFPGNGELLYLWSFLPFEDDLLVRLVSVVSWLVMGFAFYRLARQVEASRDSAISATVIAVFSPLVLSQSTEMTLDMTGAALLALALSNLFEFQEKPDIGSLVVFSVSLGAFAGVKYSGPAYALYLIVGLVFVLLFQGRDRPGFASLTMLMLSGIVSFVVGGYWYTRNWVLTGNPMYPIRVSFLDRVLFDGSHTAQTYGNTIWANIQSIPVTLLVKSLVNGYGIFVLLMVAISGFAFISGMKWSRAQRRSDESLIVRKWILSLGLLLSVFLYLRTPYSVMRFSQNEPINVRHLAAGMRFSLNAMAFGIAWVALGIEYYRWKVVHLWPILVFAVFLGVFAGFDNSTYAYFGRPIFSLSRLTFAAVLVESLWALLYFFRTRVGVVSCVLSKGRRFFTVLMIGVLLFGFALYGVNRHRERFRYPVYREEYGLFSEGWEWLAENTDNARIAFSGSFPLSYPLYGDNFSNQVRYINVQGDIDDWHHDFFRNGEYYRSHPSFRIWLQNLRHWGANYFVVSRSDHYIVESTWVDEHREIFHPVFRNAEIGIYRIDLE